MIYNAAKRIFDIAASGLGLLVLLPFAIPVFIALKLTGEGKIFFGQTRIGYRNQPFKILKLATMLEDSLNMPGGGFTSENDPRLTLKDFLGL